MKYNYGKIKADYKTPQDLIDKALELVYPRQFDLDVCCSDAHFPAKKYCIFGITDGLEVGWELLNWCNPPFDESKKWIEKAFKEQQKGNQTLMLLPARTETKYWHDYILHNPEVEITWLRKGYKFIDAATGEKCGIFKNALALVYFL